MFLDSGTCFWILGSVLDSGTCFWILGSVLDSGTCFWILGSVFGFWDVFLDSRKCFVPTSHRSFARTQRETSRNFLVTRFMKEMPFCVLVHFFFSLPLIFTWVAAKA